MSARVGASPSFYQRAITEHLVRLGRTELDARHIEAYMRLTYGTLDALGAEIFDLEVEIAVICIDAAGTSDAEGLAQSYGL